MSARCAGPQESYYELLTSGGFLSGEEAEVLAWGRNARVTVPPRFKASGSHAISYKRATAVECLVRPWRPLAGPGRVCIIVPTRVKAAGTRAISYKRARVRLRVPGAPLMRHLQAWQ